MSGVHRVLYRLPDLIAADPAATVYIVEGEKDVNRLWSVGAVATTNPMGALKWRYDFNKYLEGRNVAVMPDNDPPNVEKPADSYKGQKHAHMVAESLFRRGVSVKILELPNLPSKGDVSDWLDAGGTFDQLEELSRETRAYGLENPYHPGGQVSEAASVPMESPDDLAFWSSRQNQHRDTAHRFIEQGLKHNGRFLLADGEPYYFRGDTKTVFDLKSQDMELLLNRTYRINATESFFNYLLTR